MMMMMISSFLSSCHEKATEELCLGQIQTSLGVALCFQVFRLNFASDFFNLLLVRFHQAEIIVVKHLIQGRNNEAWVGVESSTLGLWPS